MLFRLVLGTMTALGELVAGGGTPFGCQLPEPPGMSLPGCCQLGEGRLAPCFGQGGGSPAPVTMTQGLGNITGGSCGSWTSHTFAQAASSKGSTEVLPPKKPPFSSEFQTAHLVTLPSA